jgi:hypothetical protein
MIDIGLDEKVKELNSWFPGTSPTPVKDAAVGTAASSPARVSKQEQAVNDNQRGEILAREYLTALNDAARADVLKQVTRLSPEQQNAFDVMRQNGIPVEELPSAATGTPDSTFGGQGNTIAQNIADEKAKTDVVKAGTGETPAWVAPAAATLGGGIAGSIAGYKSPVSGPSLFAPGAGTQAAIDAARTKALQGMAPSATTTYPPEIAAQIAALQAEETAAALRTSARGAAPSAATAVPTAAPSAAPTVPGNRSAADLLLTTSQADRAMHGSTAPNFDTRGLTAEQRITGKNDITMQNAANVRAGNALVENVNNLGLGAGHGDPRLIRTVPTNSEVGLVVPTSAISRETGLNIPAPQTVPYVDPITGVTVKLPAIETRDKTTNRVTRKADPAAVTAWHEQRTRDIVEAEERARKIAALQQQHTANVTAAEQLAQRAGRKAATAATVKGAVPGLLGGLAVYQSGQNIAKNGPNVENVADLTGGASAIPYALAPKLLGPLGGAAQLVSAGTNASKQGFNWHNAVQGLSGLGQMASPWLAGAGPLGWGALAATQAPALGTAAYDLWKQHPELFRGSGQVPNPAFTAGP